MAGFADILLNIGCLDHRSLGVGLSISEPLKLVRAGLINHQRRYCLQAAGVTVRAPTGIRPVYQGVRIDPEKGVTAACAVVKGGQL